MTEQLFESEASDNAGAVDLTLNTPLTVEKVLVFDVTDMVDLLGNHIDLMGEESISLPVGSRDEAVDWCIFQALLEAYGGDMDIYNHTFDPVFDSAVYGPNKDHLVTLIDMLASSAEIVDFVVGAPLLLQRYKNTLYLIRAFPE